MARGRPSTFELSGLTGRAHSSAVECLLCKEDALGSNPSGSISRVRLEPCPLSGNRGSIRVRRTDAPLRASAGGKGGRTSVVDGRVYETVCTCDPDAHWTRFIGSQSDLSLPWLLCHLVNSSAQAPTKDVPSCDKPRGAARRQRTWDFRMGIPTAIASRNGERPGLKHLSRGRKRKRTRCR